MALLEKTRTQLKTVSTATICTALFKRGLRNQFIQDVRPLKHKGQNMVGEAFTLRYIPARETSTRSPCFRTGRIPSAKRSRNARPGRSS